eukprot:CAMPEP_0177625480 /NCGR_PEP_ID=MMETSP0419_2-20121207/30125_1 /TAXON_ID=582737 /ORGANISM="Tetraselmis sp., Strain GSL018" /LENGTH=234 /DNA_ID=CAMNT_0019126435 /DNA_START=566 /DNA_END=1266 /DNA_ORIENTATION=-
MDALSSTDSPSPTSVEELSEPSGHPFDGVPFPLPSSGTPSVPATAVSVGPSGLALPSASTYPVDWSLPARISSESPEIRLYTRPAPVSSLAQQQQQQQRRRGPFVQSGEPESTRPAPASLGWGPEHTFPTYPLHMQMAGEAAPGMASQLQPYMHASAARDVASPVMPLYEPSSGAAARAAAAGGAGPSAEPQSDIGRQASGVSKRVQKRPRLIWTQELHARFENAVHHLGVKNA